MDFKFLLAISPLIPSVICFLLTVLKDDEIFVNIVLYSIAISILGFVSTSALIPLIAEYTLKKGICGKDLGKKVRFS